METTDLIRSPPILVPEERPYHAVIRHRGALQPRGRGSPINQVGYVALHVTEAHRFIHVLIGLR